MTHDENWPDEAEVETMMSALRKSAGLTVRQEVVIDGHTFISYGLPGDEDMNRWLIEGMAASVLEAEKSSS